MNKPYIIELGDSPQKFERGTVVRVAKDLGTSMSHFQKDMFAIVEYTYGQAFGGDNKKSYSLLYKYPDNKWGSGAWYDEHQLELVEDPYLCKEIEYDYRNSEKY